MMVALLGSPLTLDLTSKMRIARLLMQSQSGQVAAALPVAALLHFDAYPFTSSGTLSITSTGTMSQDTSNKKFGAGSGQFSSGGRIAIPNTTFRTVDATLEGWFYPTTTAGFQVIFGIGNEATGRRVLGFFGGNIVFDLYDDGIFHTYGAMSLNTWHHIALVRKGDETILYLNGRYLGLPSREFYAGDNMGNTGGLFIGADSNGQSAWQGRIDEIRVSASAIYDFPFVPQTAAWAGGERPAGTTGTLVQTVLTSNQTWTAPVSGTAFIEVWGGGGGISNFAGGGGAYTADWKPITASSGYAIVCNAGADAYFGSTSTVFAKAGTSTTAGSAASGVGTIKFGGGVGGGSDAGGGGGASPYGNGFDRSGQSGGASPGAGSGGGFNVAGGSNVNGGGGGGIYKSGGSPGGGGMGSTRGQVRISYYT